MRASPRRPGNIVLRRARVRPETVQIPTPRRRTLNPAPIHLVYTFVAAIALGTLLLALPIASQTREWTSGWDALFTATSAVCVTGLVRVETAAHWSGFGEAVILALFQAGGLGITMYAGILLLVVGRRLGLRSRLLFGMEMPSTQGPDLMGLLRRIMIFTVVVEVATALLLLPWFLDRDGLGGALWKSVFHAVSSFNNAGFDVMEGGGFMGQISSPYLLIVMGVAALLGSLSFIVVADVIHWPRRWRLDTKLVVIGMGGVMLVSMAALLIGELAGGRPMDGLDGGDLAANGFFLATQRTTGMATIDMSALRDSTTLILLPLMVIGGSSTSTASGIKLGAFMVLVVTILSALRGRPRPQAFGREIPTVLVVRALAITLLAIAVLLLGSWALLVTDGGQPLLPLAFEVVSAGANVGWSQGLTPLLSTGGTLVLVALMFVGRLGPIMLALAIPDRAEVRYRYPTESVRIG